LENEGPTAGIKAPNEHAEPTPARARTDKGYDLFSEENQERFAVGMRGEFNRRGPRNPDPSAHLTGRRTAQIAPCLKRSGVHGLIRSLGRTDEDDLTQMGRRAMIVRP